MARPAAGGRLALVDGQARVVHEVAAPVLYEVADGQAVLAYLDGDGALSGWLPEDGDAGTNLRVPGPPGAPHGLAECFGWCSILWEVPVSPVLLDVDERCLTCGGELELPALPS